MTALGAIVEVPGPPDWRGAGAPDPLCDALAADPAWRALDADARTIAYVAAAARARGKPAAVRAWLWRADAPFADREHVCNLVRHAALPVVALDEPDAAFRAERVSLVARNDLLVLLARADARARGDRAAEDQAELYRELCDELGVLAAPREFASDHTRVVWRESAARRPADLLAFDDTGCEVVVMCGLPAAGKDSWLAAHRPDLPVISLDALREAHDLDPADDQGAIVHAARDAARVHLRAARAFAWNATNLSRNVRAQVIELARDYRARVQVVYCEVAPDVQLARNRARREPVPAAAIARMIERWTVPAPDEAHQVSYIVE